MRTSKRLCAPLIVMFAMFIAVVASAGPASASPYKDRSTLSVSSEHPKVGSKLTVCGEGFARGKWVTISLDKRTELTSVRANHWGSFCTTIRVPDATGPHRILAKGAEGRTASVLIHIIDKSKGHGQAVVSESWSAPLKDSVVGVGALGGSLLVGGGSKLFSGRRRKVNI